MLTLQQKDTLNEYANIKQEIKMLEKKAEEINPVVLEIMRGAEVEEIAIGDMGKLSMASRRAWKYSTGTQDMEKLLKETKKEEEQTGRADYTEKHYVIFKGNE
tara:strand:+ start:109 stop:417 length:309 start_codon:yes stop_codon:yes gene_type:complete